MSEEKYSQRRRRPVSGLSFDSRKRWSATIESILTPPTIIELDPDLLAEIEPSGSLREPTEDSPEEQASTHAHESSLLVDWEKPRDPNNPMEWSTSRKVLSIMLVSLATLNRHVSRHISNTFNSNLYSSLATTITAPGVPVMMAEFRSQDEQLGSLSTSIFVIASIFGPFMFAPLR
jgi:hypothetical protein